MAYDPKNLDPTNSGSKGLKVTAAYATTDTKATVKTTGYFNAAAKDMHRVGMVRIFASDATFDAKVAIAAGVVTLSAPDTFA